MITINKSIILITISFLVLVGCDDNFLTTNPIDQISPETFYQKIGEAEMGVMGIYNSIANEVKLHPDFMSDNNYNFHDWQGNTNFGNWSHNSSNPLTATKWSVNYRTIGRANSFLQNIEESDLEAHSNTINQLIAEARYLRAMSYADLIHFYGDVPLILEVQTLDEAEIPRTAKDEVLESIIADYNYAIEHLPVTYSSSDIGRATKGAAYAMKARILLYEEKWQEAADAAQAVIDLNEYSLFPDYEGIHRYENENNEEVIFDFQYTIDLQPQPWPPTCLQYSEWWTQGVTTDIVNEYRMSNGLSIEHANSGYDPQNPAADRDPRLNSTFVLPGDLIGNIILIPDNDVFIGGIRIKKYNGIDFPDYGNCPINWIEMRYADVLLMRAEALVELGETGQEVYNFINQVRQRPSVDMPTVEEVDGTGLSQGELRELIRHERRVEFAMEGTRYSDMRRWECEECVKPVYGYNKSRLSDPNDVPENWYFEEDLYEIREFDASKGWLWPIPQNELQNNPALEQNPGY